MRELRKIVLFILNLILVISLAGCTRPQTLPLTDEDYDEVVPVTKFIYSDTCIVVKNDTSSMQMTLQNLETGLRYTLTYDNLTFLNDQYGKSLVSSQINGGEICNITFDREEKLLKSLAISSDYFVIKEVDSFTLYNSGTRLEYLGDKYDLSDNVVICSGKEEISSLELYEGDVITLHGYDHTIYSIAQNDGHGYITLANDDYFIDGFIEIGKDIRKITKDMMLTVPEGNYDILISKDGSSGIKNVTVGRNQEVEIDLSDIEIKELYGNITFNLTPEDASIYIDGTKVDNVDKPQRLECGVHELLVRADGYETISRYISVGTMDAELNIKLDKLKDDSKDNKEDKQESTNNDNNSADNSNNNSEDNKTEGNDTTNQKRVYVNAPQGAELYLDGNYIGVVPTSFAKTSGNIVITLRKDGCQTRSYSINLEDMENDSSYSFSELLKLTD